MNLKEVTAYLDDYLNVPEIPDYAGAVNGLQVESGRDIRRIAVAVDACLFTIEQALAEKADLLLVHHGLFWGMKAPLTGLYYKRIAGLIKNDIALYSSHLPLDVHPEVGNNVVLAKKLNLTPSGSFYPYEGVPVGLFADTDTPFAAFVQNVRDVLSREPTVIGTGPKRIKRVGVLTGGGGSAIANAYANGIDTLLTGEGAHHTYFEAEERGMNVVYAGHYATETVGVQALARHLENKFGLETLFIDHPTEL